MNFEIMRPESAKEPRIWVEHQPMLGLVLHPGSIESGADGGDLHASRDAIGSFQHARRPPGEKCRTFGPLPEI